MTKKILLISPPVISTKGARDINPYPPLGLAYLAATLKLDGHDIVILDCFLKGIDYEYPINEKEIRIGLDIYSILSEIEKFKPDYIGITNQFSRQRNIVYKILKNIKIHFPDIVTVVGGAHPSASEDIYDNFPTFVVMGEGEKAVRDIVNGAYEKKDVTQIVLAGKNQILDMLPFPDWKTANLKDYFGSPMSHGYRKHERFAPVQTSRGCTAMCVFCSAHKVYGRKFRARSAADVIMELINLKTNYDIQEIMFEDDNLTLDPKRAEQIFYMMTDEKLNFKWDTPNGIAIWTLSERLIDKMVESGCHTINFPLESGSQRVLREVIRKPINLKRAKELIRYAKTTGVNVGLFLVVGIPGETKKEIEQTLRLGHELGIYFPHISIATPYPGTKLAKLFEHNPQYNFNYNDLHIRKANISTHEWSADELIKMLKWNRYERIARSFINEPIKTYEKYRRSKQ